MNPTAIEINVEHAAWSEAVPDLEALITRMAEAALADADCDLGDDPLEISVVLADDATVQVLNREWRGKDKPTNVLSFASLDDDDAPRPPGAPLLLGDIILAFETCRAEAVEQGKPMAEHLSHLVVHGVLHLLGYDHEEDEIEAEEMERLEAAILARFGIADPYLPSLDDNPTESNIAEGGR
ncbi:MAG: rRNA maturation RNase YbeY [Rhodospirillaceae bacterium]|nr:rRNA maturation RNase YbeY [Rhodospirillales bacterium]